MKVPSRSVCLWAPVIYPAEADLTPGPVAGSAAKSARRDAIEDRVRRARHAYHSTRISKARQPASPVRRGRGPRPLSHEDLGFVRSATPALGANSIAVFPARNARRVPELTRRPFSNDACRGLDHDGNRFGLRGGAVAGPQRDVECRY